MNFNESDGFQLEWNKTKLILIKVISSRLQSNSNAWIAKKVSFDISFQFTVEVFRVLKEMKIKFDS